MNLEFILSILTFTIPAEHGFSSKARASSSAECHFYGDEHLCQPITSKNLKVENRRSHEDEHCHQKIPWL